MSVLPCGWKNFCNSSAPVREAERRTKILSLRASDEGKWSVSIIGFTSPLCNGSIPIVDSRSATLLSSILAADHAAEAVLLADLAELGRKP